MARYASIATVFYDFWQEKQRNEFWKMSRQTYLMYFMLLFLGITMVYGGIEKFLSNEIEKSLLITSLIFGIPFTLLSSYRLFYTRKNRFYITTQGIGFERRHWFVMQKGCRSKMLPISTMLSIPK